MATGSVSALDQDTWQVVATNTPTSGTTSTFSGLSGYKKYMLVAENITGTSGELRVTFNGSSSNYINEIYVTANSKTYIILALGSTSASAYMSIDNVNNGGPKVTFGIDYNAYEVYGMWNNPDPITSITVTRTQAYTGGTLTLYGIAG
jgi:hypothetical protein